MAKIGYIQVTRLCNQKCIICSNPPTERFLTLENAKKEVDQMKKEGLDGIIITGGEPTIYDHLPELISYINKLGLFPRIITNGQKMSNVKYAKTLKDSGLRHVHVSIYSYKKKIQEKISQNPDSLKNICKTLDNIKKLVGIQVDINIAMCKLNVGHLSKTVNWLVKRYPFVEHYVFNNLDPYMNRASENVEIVPAMRDIELELNKSLRILEKNKKTFRVERVPLCYLSGYEFVSTETRKIVKEESRTIYFLDEKNKVTQEIWQNKKSECCRNCTLNSICAGIYGEGGYYSTEELSPVFVEIDEIIKRIKK